MNPEAIPGGQVDRAVIALVSAAGEARSLVPLLSVVGVGHELVSWHRSDRRPVDAVVASDPGVLASIDLVARARGTTSPPVACRVRSEADFDAAVRLGAVVTFTDLADLAAPNGPLGDTEPVLVPSPGLDVARFPVIPPLARARMREAFGLSDPLVLAVEGGAPRASSSTSLALASAAVIVDPHALPLAMALGTPAVVAVDLAERFGLTHSVEVLVSSVEGGTHAADRTAAALARDADRCAALSRRARRHAERHLDLGSAGVALRMALRLEPEQSLVDLRLAELATPRSSRLFVRAHDALDLFSTEATR